MIDITSKKVVLPIGIFMGLNVLAPGNCRSLNALIMVILYQIMAKILGMVLQPADLIVPSILTMVLTPFRKTPDKIVVHASMFAILFAFLRKIFPQFY